MTKFFLILTLPFVLLADTLQIDVPARLQWFHNTGYCGETSFISAGLYYGQYLSQFDVRALVTPDGSQTGGSLLLGINDARAADIMHLTYEEWDTSSQENTDQFLIWLKQKIVEQNPVVIGVYANQYKFYQKTNPHAGDPDYDHIVSAMSLISDHSLTDPSYYPSDQIGFNDNGYWEHQKTPVYFFTYGFELFQADRVGANAPDGPIYSLADDGSNYGIAITGIKDLNGDTLPVRIHTNLNYEKPEIAERSNQRPHPMALTLNVTISDLDPDTSYILYRYDRLDAVPDSEFNANGAAALEKWAFQPTSSTYVHIQTIQSNETAVYRCVQASAP